MAEIVRMPKLSDTMTEGVVAEWHKNVGDNIESGELLAEIDLGNGTNYNPQEALNMFFQTGSVIGRSMNELGEPNQGRIPIQEITSGSGGNKLQALIGNYNYYLQMIRDTTGLNEARDGSTPDPNSLVGLQKLAALNSNVATRHILDGSLYIYRSIAEALTYRVADILQYADFKDEFVNQIGKYNVSILNDISDLYIYDFGIFIELSPDEEQKQQLEQNIQMALSKGDINLEDAIDIREVKNLKLANQLLKMKRISKQDREEKMQMQQQAMQSQQMLKAQEMKQQQELQRMQMETRSKMEYRQADIAFEIEKMKNEAMLKSQLMDKEFQLNVELAKLNNQGLSDREQAREDAKAKRISQANTEQSKMINQRKNNLPPINFESNEDSLDGFDLAEFEPR